MAIGHKHKTKDSLPRTTVLLIQILGPVNILTLVKKFGGIQIKFPKLDTFDSPVYRDKLARGITGHDMMWIHKTFGMAVLRNLCTIFSGLEVSVPSQITLERFSRNQQILKRFNGHNMIELALEFDLTVGGIRKIIFSDKKGRIKYMRWRRRKRGAA